MYPNRNMLEAMCRTALNGAYVKSDITGDGIPETYCNCFVHSVAVALGCNGFSQSSGAALTATQIIDRVRADMEWTALGRDAEQAQEWANQGYLVIAAHRASPHSHVAIVVPGATQESGKHGHRLPLGANVGRDNFVGKHLGWAFTHQQCPEYFGWKGPK